LNWTHTWRRFAAKNCYRRENGEKEKKRKKTETDDAGLDDGRWKAERRGLIMSGVVTSYIRTCREPEEELL